MWAWARQRVSARPVVCAKRRVHGRQRGLRVQFAYEVSGVKWTPLRKAEQTRKMVHERATSCV